MRIIADMHCHTTASTHAYSSVYENITAALENGLYAIAITDHSESTPGAPGMWYFQNLGVIPREVDGINVLRGVEANVLNNEGELDIPETPKQPLDWVIASIHDFAFSGEHNVDECTQLWLNIANNPIVNVIGHSGSPNFKYDYDKVIPEFGKNGKLVEINNSSFKIRKEYVPNCKKIALACKKHDVSVIVNSDAHFCKQVGVFDDAIKLLEEIDFPEELVINADTFRFQSYLEKYTHFFTTK